MIPERLYRLTRAEYYSDFLITLPITLTLLMISAYHYASWSWAAWVIVGMFVWTFAEYAIHRWVLHGLTAVGKMHAAHHRNQRDYIALHPAATVAFYAMTWIAFGGSSTAGVLGYSLGYVVYAGLHTAFHYMRITIGHPLYSLKRRHAIHHSLDWKNYGVTTSLWDRVFGTEY